MRAVDDCCVWVGFDRESGAIPGVASNRANRVLVLGVAILDWPIRPWKVPWDNDHRCDLVSPVDGYSVVAITRRVLERETLGIDGGVSFLFGFEVETWEDKPWRTSFSSVTNKCRHILWKTTI